MGAQVSAVLFGSVTPQSSCLRSRGCGTPQGFYLAVASVTGISVPGNRAVVSLTGAFAC